MIRVLLSNGAISECYEARVLCEEIVELDEERKRVFEGCDDIRKANALMLEFEAGVVYIGNLGNDRIQKVLRGMAEKGYLNCMDLDLEVVSKSSEVKPNTPYIQLGDDGTEKNPFGVDTGFMAGRDNVNGFDPFADPFAGQPAFSPGFGFNNNQGCGCNCCCRCGQGRGF